MHNILGKTIQILITIKEIMKLKIYRIFTFWMTHEDVSKVPYQTIQLKHIYPYMFSC